MIINDRRTPEQKETHRALIEGGFYAIYTLRGEA